MASAPSQPAAWDIGHLDLRYDVVWSFAVSSLRVRFGRTLLTTLTIATAAAFMMFLLTAPRGEGNTERQTWGLMLVLSLIVAAVGVLNTMLMSVTQRYREIGTIKCLGGLDRMILLSVLVEAAMVGVVGAGIGVLFGLVLAVLISLVDAGASGEAAVAPLVVLGNIGLVTVLTAVLTTLSAAMPAWIASRMPPIEAMRGEK